jgi:hypothetical protein
MTGWPRPDRAALDAFYGVHELSSEGKPTARWEATQLVSIVAPYPLRLSWQIGTTVHRLRCHRKVADSLKRILTAIWEACGRNLATVQAARLDLFGGCYEYRRARGGSALSLHAWGAAIDIDPERNGLGVEWRDGAGMLPRFVIDIFRSEGWTWGGDFSRPDAMHFEATSAAGTGTAPPAGATGGAAIPSPASPAAAPSPAATTAEPGLGDRVRNTLSLPPLDRVQGPNGSYSQLHADVTYTLRRHLEAGGTWDTLDRSVAQRIWGGYLVAHAAGMLQLVREKALAANIVGQVEAFNWFTRVHGDPFLLLMAEARRLLIDWKARPV